MAASTDASATDQVSDTLTWELDEQPSESDLSLIASAVTRHGRALACSDARPLACWVRRHGQIVAGACGRTELSRLFVNYLWVDESLRRQGLATELLSRLEAAARQQGCVDAALETLSDDVARWYGRRGWRTVALVPRWVGGFNRHILVKPLAGAAATRITLERADQADTVALIDALDSYQRPLYPPESHHGVDIDTLMRPQVLFAVMRTAEGLAVGCGALMLSDDESVQGAAASRWGELKRMYLQPAWRGGGRARAMLAHLEDAGRARGCTCFRLETGIHQHEALAFYAGAGYEQRGPFADYAPDPLSVFMEKRFTA
jgi:putative acetyltransferase